MLPVPLAVPLRHKPRVPPSHIACRCCAAALIMGAKQAPIRVEDDRNVLPSLPLLPPTYYIVPRSTCLPS